MTDFVGFLRGFTVLNNREINKKKRILEILMGMKERRM